jgi:glycosyltransferase involved in cell wall biosynthesis
MSANQKKVCHLTSVHSKFDTRIFYKECKTLFNAGYAVALVVQNEKDEVIDGVQIMGIKTPKNRKERMLKTTKQVYKRALESNANIYHFHDPELIPIALKLKRKGKIVIYDVHEDVPRQILSKQWIPAPLRKIAGWVVEKIESYSAKRFDGIVTATTYIAARFNIYNQHVFTVRNYPINEKIWPKANLSNYNQVCYISSHLSLDRGIIPIIEAMRNINAKLILAGKMEQSVHNLITSLDGWEKAEYVGFVSKEKVQEIMSQSKVGLAIFSLEPNYINALPTKMFEYMQAGLPVVVNDIPILREIVDKHKCGICVTPMSADEITEAVNWILSNPYEARKMGARGQYAIETEYNWTKEENRLLELYDILNN